MTEREWLGCNEPAMMLDLLWSKFSDRKLRLLACATLRLMEGVENEALALSCIKVCERYADAEASDEGMSEIRAIARKKWSRLHELNPSQAQEPWGLIAGAAYQLVRQDAWKSFVEVDTAAERSGVKAYQRAGLLREMFENPGQPPRFRAVWRTSTVLALAQAIYQERAFERLPILADALQDAGCDDPAILEHLRGENIHVRGCHVVDVVLGRE